MHVKICEGVMRSKAQSNEELERKGLVALTLLQWWRLFQWQQWPLAINL